MTESYGMRHSPQYGRLVRQVAKRRRDLLKVGPKQLLYPPIGQMWYPSDRELALCEAFIVFFVAEFENYIEDVMDTCLNFYESGIVNSGLSDCNAATEYVEKIVNKRKSWERNNHTTWNRTSEYWLFVGLNKDKFPDNLWDYIDSVSGERGAIAHKSLGVRGVTDPRITFETIDKIRRSLAVFDRDFLRWQAAWDAEIVRYNKDRPTFVAGLGSIGIQQ